MKEDRQLAGMFYNALPAKFEGDVFSKAQQVDDKIRGLLVESKIDEEYINDPDCCFAVYRQWDGDNWNYEITIMTNKLRCYDFTDKPMD